jgi:flagellar biosynthesis protein FlhG
MPKHRSTPRSHKITVASGKGGVGKTNIAANLAILLSNYGKRVLLYDADLGLASVDTLLNLMPERTIENVMLGECKLCDIVIKGPGNLSVLPAAPGICEMATLSAEDDADLRTQLRELFAGYDYIVIDAPPGIGANVQRLLAMSNEVLLVATPEPTAVIDAYAMLKLMCVRHPKLPLRLVLNMVGACDTGERICAGFNQVASRFLDRKIDTIGRLPLDPHVAMSVRRQQAFTQCYPDCPATQSLRAMALNLLNGMSSMQNTFDASATPELTGANFEHSSSRSRLSSWVDPKVG